MPLNRSCSIEAFKANVAAEIDAGKSRDQAVAVATATLRDSCGGLNLPLPSVRELGDVAREFRRKGGHSREYLEEALKEAKSKLSHRDYAVLHHAARSRAGGRVTARQRATTVEKALALGPQSLLEHELLEAIERTREMLAADLRMGRLLSVAKMLGPELEAEARRRSGNPRAQVFTKSDPGPSDVHVQTPLGGNRKKKTPESAAQRVLLEASVMKADRSDDPGVMIAFRLPENTARAIALEDGESPDRLHCTLAYLGRMSQLGPSGLEAATAAIRAAVAGAPVLRGALAGIGRFAGTESSDNKDVIFALVDVPGLTDFRHRLVCELQCRGVPLPSKHDYTPHVTLAYVSEREPTPKLNGTIRLRDIYFDAVTLAVNDADTSFALGELSLPAVEAPSPEAFAISMAKGEPLLLPSVHAEVIDGPGGMRVALNSMGLSVDESRYEVGDLVQWTAKGIEPSDASEPTPYEEAGEIIKSVTDLVQGALPIDFSGPADARVIFVSTAPTELEAARREAMVGEDGVVFAQRYLGPLMLTKSQVAIGFALPILPEPPVAGPELLPPDAPASSEQLARWGFWLEKNLAKWPDAKVVAIGKSARELLGPRASLSLPHPSVVRRYDSGEVSRKLRAFAKSLDDGSRIGESLFDHSESPSTGQEGRVAEAMGELRTAGQILVRVSKAADEKRIVYGVVLDPYQVDAHGDWIPPAEIESTAHGFLKKSRIIGVEHRRKATAQLVESFVMPYPTVRDYELAMQNAPHKVYEMPYGEDIVHSGAWIAGVELGPEEWAAHKRDELNAFSVGGFSFKTKVPAAAMPKVEYVKLAALF